MVAPSTSQHLAHVRPPSVLKGDATLLDFNCWYQAWSDYSSLIGLGKLSQKEQLGLFRSALSNEMKDVIFLFLGYGLRIFGHCLGFHHDLHSSNFSRPQ